ncbi:MAG: hypothetical protein FGF48_06310 [Candidatus Brockarchaeota archaeon]|nr:hypothetical protein [Candidatus Brockarchaeota archaeon]
MNKKKKSISFLPFLFLVFPLLISPYPVYAYPPWLKAGFYAKYNISTMIIEFISDLTDPYFPKTEGSCYDDYYYHYGYVNGTFFWKVEKIEGKNLLLKVNFSLRFRLINNSYGEISKSFHLLVDMGTRLILNTTDSDLLYFPYWIPIGTKVGDKAFLGHQRLENTWIVGEFVPWGGEDIITGWKKFSNNDVILLVTKNQTGFTRRNPLIFLAPVFNAFYDKETGILINLMGCEPLLLKFFNIYIDTYVGIMVLDSIGVEPVSNVTHDHDSSATPNISVSGIKVPSQIEVGSEFELSLTILNNSTTVIEGLRVLLSCLNGNIKILSSEEVLIGSMQPEETREARWRLLLQSEGEYTLRYSILKDDVKLLEKDLVIEGKLSLLQRVKLFMIIFPIFGFVLVTIALLRRRNKTRNVRFKHGEI